MCRFVLRVATALGVTIATLAVNVNPHTDLSSIIVAQVSPCDTFLRHLQYCHPQMHLRPALNHRFFLERRACITCCRGDPGKITGSIAREWMPGERGHKPATQAQPFYGRCQLPTHDSDGYRLGEGEIPRLVRR